jgi:hypothetical protein
VGSVVGEAHNLWELFADREQLDSPACEELVGWCVDKALSAVVLGSFIYIYAQPLQPSTPTAQILMGALQAITTEYIRRAMFC